MSRQHPFFSRQNKPLNIDITHRCALECIRCGRQTSFRNKGKTVPGYNLSLEEFDKITDHFHKISFCGQYSDPIHHPQFIELLKVCYQKGRKTEVHVASTARPKRFFIDAFKANPDATWIFGIDGLPEESHKYRINQDGQKLFEIMLESRQHLTRKPHWQYIVFKYNQEHIKKAMEIAKFEGVLFDLIRSSRWDDKDQVDPLKPTIGRDHAPI